MDFIELEYITTLAEEKNFTRAAEKMMVAQPNLSSAIAKMEKNLNFPLFYREKSGIELTPEGKRYVAIANKILAMKHEMDAELRAVSKEISGRIQFYISPFLARCVLTSFLPDFSASHPEIELAVHTDSPENLVRQMKERTIEAAVMVEGEKVAGYTSQTLYYEPIVLAIAKDSPLTKQSYEAADKDLPVIPSACLKEAEYVMAEPNSWLRKTAEEFFAENDIHPREVVTSASIGAVNRLAALGVGVGFIPYTFATMHDLEDVPGYYYSENGPGSWKVNLYIRDDLVSKQYIQTFAESLKAYI